MRSVKPADDSSATCSHNQTADLRDQLCVVYQKPAHPSQSRSRLPISPGRTASPLWRQRDNQYSLRVHAFYRFVVCIIAVSIVRHRKTNIECTVQKKLSVRVCSCVHMVSRGSQRCVCVCAHNRIPFPYGRPWNCVLPLEFATLRRGIEIGIYYGTLRRNSTRGHPNSRSSL